LPYIHELGGDPEEVPMRRLVIAVGGVLALLAWSGVGAADDVPTVAQQLAAAQKAGRPTFLLVTEPRARGLEALRLVVEEARKEAPHVVSVEMDRTEAANKAVVKRYGLAGAKVPLVLVIAHNGAPGGGVVPGPKAGEQLLALLPSPRKADTLLALFERKAAFVVVGRPEMPGRKAALAACLAARAELEEKAAVIEVDLQDEAEQGFLEVLGADRKAEDVAVHVYALSGRKTEVLKGAGVTSGALVQAATKKAECCPGGKCG
jgi:hypothetical protein